MSFVFEEKQKLFSRLGSLLSWMPSQEFAHRPPARSPLPLHQRCGHPRTSATRSLTPPCNTHSTHPSSDLPADAPPGNGRAGSLLLAVAQPGHIRALCAPSRSPCPDCAHLLHADNLSYIEHIFEISRRPDLLTRVVEYRTQVLKISEEDEVDTKLTRIPSAKKYKGQEPPPQPWRASPLCRRVWGGEFLLPQSLALLTAASLSPQTSFGSPRRKRSSNWPPHPKRPEPSVCVRACVCASVCAWRGPAPRITANPPPCPGSDTLWLPLRSPLLTPFSALSQPGGERGSMGKGRWGGPCLPLPTFLTLVAG